MPDIKKLIQEVEGELALLNYGNHPAELYDPIRYIMQLGGKRLRPVLVLMGAYLFDNNYRKAMPAALAVEVFHNFTLVHDDIMDNAPLRRGQATVHEKWNSSTAILSGDVMFAEAYELLLNLDFEPIRSLIKDFGQTAKEVCEGQQLDMNFECRDDVSVSEYLEMIRLKTAVLLGFSLKAGALLGGAGADEAEVLYKYGMGTGVVFQILDDLLDVYADAAAFGKQVAGDIVSNKKTFLLLTAFEKADTATKAELNRWINKKEFDAVEKIEAIKAIYARLGVKEHTEARVNRLHLNNEKLLAQLSASPAKKELLSTYAGSLLVRQK